MKGKKNIITARWMALAAGCSSALCAGASAGTGPEEVLAVFAAVQDEAGAAEADLTPEIASALTFGPLQASSICEDLGVTLVGARSASDTPRTVHALIKRPQRIVRWVQLPLQDLPEAVFVVSENRFVCMVQRPGGGTELMAFDATGALQSSSTLGDMLPPETQRSAEAVSLVVADAGPSLTVPLSCGTLAIVELLGPEHAEPFRVCSMVLSQKHACGVDAWLTQARQLAREGDLGAARYALEAAIETDPSDARGYRELAQFFHRDGQSGEQLRCLKEGVERLHEAADGVVSDDWQVGTPAARLALDYVTATRNVMGPAAAVDALNSALALYPCMEQAVLLQAELLIEGGDPEAAAQFLRSALGQLDPNADLAAAYHDVGRFLRKSGNPAAAILFLEDSYALGDDSEFLLRGLSELSLEMGAPGRAAEWLSHLANRWRVADNGDSEEFRSERNNLRLRELEEEITLILSLSERTGD